MKYHRRFAAGFTLIELMMVVGILGVLSSIMVPRFGLILQKATQSAAKGNLGQIRSSLGLYYADMEGMWPLRFASDGYADAQGLSMSETLAPRYVDKLPTPQLAERVGSFNGLSLAYDPQAAAWMSYSPPKDIVILRGPASPTPFVNRPWVYDPENGLLYICNGNYDSSGSKRFFEW
jgi:prepilin-type N-terminal cleavage/methylation domain-containing protein